MSKVINERYPEAYKGLVMTTSLLKENVIMIEYNLQFPNEIGHQFQKSFVNYREVEEFSKKLNLEKQAVDVKDEQIEELGCRSNVKMMEDILNDNLPAILDGFEYIHCKKGLADLYKLILNCYEE